MSNFVVTGIDTNVGKTFISKVLLAGLNYDYWKPVQTGTIEESDSQSVKSIFENSKTKIFSESYSFLEPCSPHKAAILENTEIVSKKIQIPSSNNLLIEGAGGLMVPLNPKELLIDLFQMWNFPLILVVNCYLGSINHTLLSLEIIKQKNIPLKGIIFNQNLDPEAENFIEKYSKVRILGRVPKFDKLPKNEIEYKEIYNPYLKF